MMQPPLISIVVPVYNGSRWLEECLESILAQDYTNKEIIVVDDASTDDSALIAEHLLPEAGTMIIRNPKNLGECETSNIGARKVNGKYFTRLGQDDAYFDPSHLSHQMQVMENSESDWCYDTVTLNGPDLEHSRVVRSYWTPIPLRYCSEWMAVFDNLILAYPDIAFEIWKMGRSPVNASCTMYRTESYRKIAGSMPYRTAWDGIVLGRMLKANMFGTAINDYPGVFYREHEGQTANTELYRSELKEFQKKGLV